MRERKLVTDFNCFYAVFLLITIGNFSAPKGFRKKISVFSTPLSEQRTTICQSRCIETASRLLVDKIIFFSILDKNLELLIIKCLWGLWYTSPAKKPERQRELLRQNRKYSWIKQMESKTEFSNSICRKFRHFIMTSSAAYCTTQLSDASITMRKT